MAKMELEAKALDSLAEPAKSLSVKNSVPCGGIQLLKCCEYRSVPVRTAF